MEQKEPTSLEQEEKILDSIARTLVLIARQISFKEKEEKEKLNSISDE